MNIPFRPVLDVLPVPQQALWPDLSQVPADFVLWGGTALALQLGHRQSVDFDFFSDKLTEPDQLIRSMPLLQSARILQRSPGTLTAQVDRGGPVNVSFFMVPGVLRPMAPPLQAAGNGLQIATLADLAAMKAKVVCDRAEAKDYIDIDAILTKTTITLGDALAAAKLVYGDTFNPLPTLKALTFFEDGNLGTLPADLKARLVEAVRTVDPLRLPSLTRIPFRERT